MTDWSITPRNRCDSNREHRVGGSSRDRGGLPWGQGKSAPTICRRRITRRTSLHGIARIDWTTSRYARYVGRVGALAVALGIGGALVTTPGMAWADDSPSAPSSEAGPSSSPSGSEPDEKTTPTSSSSDGSPTDPTPSDPRSNESAMESQRPAPRTTGNHIRRHRKPSLPPTRRSPTTAPAEPIPRVTERNSPSPRRWTPNPPTRRTNPAVGPTRVPTKASSIPTRWPQRVRYSPPAVIRPCATRTAPPRRSRTPRKLASPRWFPICPIRPAIQVQPTCGGCHRRAPGQPAS